MSGVRAIAQDLPSRAEIEAAAKIVYRFMPPTPQYHWPLLGERAGRAVWVKHENHTPLGAFKMRGGLVFFEEQRAAGALPAGAICATRGNHGQSVAFAGRQFGVAVTIVVPHGNSVEKNAAMRALGARLIEYGDDFQASLEHAMELAGDEELLFVPSFHPALVRGVATCAMEFLLGSDPLDAMYVPIGLGSGLCGALAARNALGAATEVIAVVAEEAPAFGRSLEAEGVVSVPSTTIADGMSCRTPNAQALAAVAPYRPRVVYVSDEAIVSAVRAIFTDTHNVAETAGAAALAAALCDPQRERFRSVGVVLSGGNVDAAAFAQYLSA
jgi:threonine dehydratase